MTLEDYIKFEYAAGKIDFSFRAHVYDGQVVIYIHPTGRDGTTTPNLIVEGNKVRMKLGDYMPGWSAEDDQC